MRAVAVSVFAGALGLCLCPALPGPLTWVVPMAALLPFWRRVPARLALLVCVGFAWAWLHADARLRDRLPVAFPGTAVTIDGVVRGLPDCRGDVCRFLVDVSDADAAGVAGRRVRLSWYEAPVSPAAGERWQLVVRLRAPGGFAVPGAFDYEGWLFRHGIDGVGYVRTSTTNRRVHAGAPAAWLDRLRGAVAERLRTALGPREATAIVTALVTGDRRGLSPDQWETLARTGTGHLMAISGLHVGLVAGAVFLGLSRCTRRATRLPRALRSRGFAAACALVAALAYALLAGFTLPTRRALVMAAFVLAAASVRRPLAVSHSLSAALLGALLLAPLSPVDPGFWLSFGAVAAIALGAAGRPQWSGPLAFGRVQWAVTVGLMPVLAALFGQVSLVSPLANAVAIPLFSFAVVPLTLGGAMLNSVIPPVGQALLWLAAAGIDGLWTVLDALAAPEWVVARVPARPLLPVALAGAGVAWLIGPAGPVSRAAALLLLVPLAAWRPTMPPSGAFELAVLDVGQGLAVLVTTRHHALLYDAGPAFRSGSDAGSVAVLPYLDARLARPPDMLMVSHGDTDHRGGASSVTSRYPDLAVVGEAMPGARPCTAGESWSWDGVVFEVLYPDHGGGSDGNDGSCVLSVTAGSTRVLLPGDIEAGGEAALVASGRSLASGIVVVPHHGSATSSTAAFVAAVAPRYALVAAGHDNRWGHPRPEVVGRWRAAGARVLTTARSGTIELRVSPTGHVGAPYRHRVDGRRLWTVVR